MRANPNTRPAGPTRLLIPAGFALAFFPLYLAPDHGWKIGGIVGGGVALLILLGPWLLGIFFRMLAAAAAATLRKKKRKK